MMYGVQCPLEAGRTRWRDESGEQQFRQNYKDSREVSSMPPGLCCLHVLTSVLCHRRGLYQLHLTLSMQSKEDVSLSGFEVTTE